MKRCPDCGEWRPSEEFPRNKNCQDGRHPYCKPCHNARRYGIGATEVGELIRQQGGLCAICGRENPEHVDHSHETGRVRGILCFNCNGGLGQFSDNTERLANTIEHLDGGLGTRIEAPELERPGHERARALTRVG